MALFYGIRNFEYTYGYRKTGQLYFVEYFPDTLETLYAGKSAGLYLCAPENAPSTEILNEAVSAQPVPILKEKGNPDICEALLEQERQGGMQILRYGNLTQEMLSWIRKAEAAEIWKHAFCIPILPWPPICTHTIPRAGHNTKKKRSPHGDLFLLHTGLRRIRIHFI